MGRHCDFVVRSFYNYDAIENKSICNVCDTYLSGKHVTNLRRHLQTKHNASFQNAQQNSQDHHEALKNIHMDTYRDEYMDEVRLSPNVEKINQEHCEVPKNTYNLDTYANEHIDEFSKPKTKRRRVNPTHVWTDLQTETLLQGVCDAFKEQPEQFEKPTSEAFYNKIKERTPILEHISWLSLKCKMRHLKVKYLDAVCWKENTDIDEPASGKDHNMIEFIEKISPYWDTLGEIFKRYTYTIPDSVCEESPNDAELSNTFESNYYDSSDGELEFKFDPEAAQPSTSQNSFVFTPSNNVNNDKTNSFEAQKLKRIPINFQQNHTNNMPVKKSCTKSLGSLALIKEQKLVAESGKLELEKERLRNDFELRKIELQNEFELKKFEIGLRIESEERIKKYEIDLKFKRCLNN